MAQTQKVGKTATKVYLDAENTHVRYHSTVVVRFGKGTVELNSGGWRTRTTKMRMNQTSNQYDLGFQVFQNDSEWFVSFKGETLDFQDRMILQR